MTGMTDAEAKIPPNVLLAGIVGSTAYGLANEDSDTDRLGLFAAPTEAVIGLSPPAGSVVSTSPDVTFHEAGKMASLLLKCNPTVNGSRSVILLSGRPESSRTETVLWLDLNGVAWEELHMRADGDFRSDAIVKRELFDRCVRDRFDVQVVLDDRNRVVELWRSLGLPCWQVNDGDF